MKKTLLIVLTSLIIGFFIGKNIKNSSPNPVLPLTVDPKIVSFFSLQVTKTLEIELDPSYSSTLFDAEPLWSLPEQPTADLPTGNMSGLKPFDENEGSNGFDLLVEWQIKNIDINGDDIDEQAMTNGIGLSGFPHIVRIVKDNMVVFEFEGTRVEIEDVTGEKPGFILTTQIWQQESGKRVRYIIEDDGTIVPLWQQRYAAIKYY